MIEETVTCQKCTRDIPAADIKAHKNKCLGKDKDSVFEENFSSQGSASRSSSAMNIEANFDPSSPVFVETNMSVPPGPGLKRHQSDNLYNQTISQPPSTLRYENDVPNDLNQNQRQSQRNSINAEESNVQEERRINFDSYPSFNPDHARENVRGGRNNYPSFDRNFAREGINMERRDQGSNARGARTINVPQYSSLGNQAQNGNSVSQFRTDDGTLIERRVKRTGQGTAVEERIVQEGNNGRGRGNRNQQQGQRSNFPYIPGLPQREATMLNEAFSNHSNYRGSPQYQQYNRGQDNHNSQRRPATNAISTIFNQVFGNNDAADRRDNYGIFSLFGESPFDPMFEQRSFSRRYNDPFENNLMQFVNMMRMNRTNVFNPGWISMIIGNIPRHQRSKGLTKEALGEIELIKFDKDPTLKEEEQEKCPVCLIEFEDKEEIKKLPCGHLFHGGCIDTWLSKNTKCPICKRDVAKKLDEINQEKTQQQLGNMNQNNQNHGHNHQNHNHGHHNHNHGHHNHPQARQQRQSQGQGYQNQGNPGPLGYSRSPYHGRNPRSYGGYGRGGDNRRGYGGYGGFLGGGFF